MPVPGLLGDRASRREDGGLPLDLVADGALDTAQAVDVLRLGAGAQDAGAARRERDVRVAAQVAALHPGLADAEGRDDVADRRHVRLRKFRRVAFRTRDHLRDDLDERDARTVVVDERILCAVDAAGRPTHVRELAGVLLHVGPLDLDAEGLATGQFHLDDPVVRDGFVVLADLVVLGEVGVEVVLAREPARRRDLTAQREAEADRVPDGLFVDDRERSRQAEAHGRDHGVRLLRATGCLVRRRGRVRRRREHLRLRVELDVDLEAEHRLEELESLVEVHEFRGAHRMRPSRAVGVTTGATGEDGPSGCIGARLRSELPQFASSSASSVAPTV